MAFSRRSKFEEKILQKRFIVLIASSLALVLFVMFFGLQALIGFSVGIDKLRGNTKNQDQQTVVYLPTPQLNPIPEATFSGQIAVSGYGQAYKTIQLYVNNTESATTKTASDGAFLFKSVSLDAGANTLAARQLDDSKNQSALSRPLAIFVTDKKPLLEISSPENGARVTGEKNVITVSGKTDENARVHINDRIVIVRSDGSFSFDYFLPEGDTKLLITATNEAGIKTEVTRDVRYEK